MQARPNADALLSHSVWLRKLAWDLVGDAQRAEDVVQETWVTALERPPHFLEDGQRLKAWLAQVTRNLARMSRRGEARRAVRERSSARPEALPSLHESMERVALQREVVSAVMSLRSPEREIVVLRYFEGRQPAKIATDLGMTSSAVRTRLSRALSTLRQRLDSAEDGGRDRWAPALLAWASSKPATAAGTLLGGSMMKSAWKAAAVLALVVAGWLGVRAAWPHRPESAQALAAAEPNPLETPGAQLAAASATGARAEKEPNALHASDPPAVGDTQPRPVVVRGRCVDRAGAPVAGVQIDVGRADRDREWSTDEDGGFELDLPWRDDESARSRQRIALQFQRAEIATAFAYLTVPGPGTYDVPDVTLEPGGSVTGRVVHADGSPFAGVRVDPIQPVSGDRRARERAEVESGFVVGSSSTVSGDDGSFRIDGVPATVVSISTWHQSAAADAEPYPRALSEPVEVPVGASVDAGAIVLRPASVSRRIRGRVLGPDGSPAEVARVEIEREGERFGPKPRAWRSSSMNPGAQFDVLVERDFAYTVTVTAPGCRATRVEEVFAGSTPLELRLVPRARCEVRITDSEGRALDEFRVHARIGGLTQPLDFDGPLADGAAVVLLADETAELYAEAPGFLPGELGSVDPNAPPASLSVQLQRAGGIAGRIVLDGQPLADVSVHAHLSPEPRHPEDWRYRTASSDETGAFFLPLSLSGSFTLHAEHGQHARTRLGIFTIGRGEQLDVGDLPLVQGGRIQGSVVAPDGVRAAGWAIGATLGDGHVEGAMIDATGRFEFDGLGPGRWSVALFRDYQSAVARRVEDRLPLQAEPRVAVVVESGQTSHATLDLSGFRRVALRGSVRLNGRAAEGATVTLADARSVIGVTLDDRGEFVTRVQPENSYEVRVHQSPVEGLRFDWGGSVSVAQHASEWAIDLACGTVELSGLQRLGPEMQVELAWRGPSGEHWRARVTRASGSDADEDMVRLDHVPAGELICTVRAGHGTQPERRELTVSEGQFVQLDL